MPDGSVPSNTLTLYQVDSDGIGPFGPRLREITRIGLDELRYIKGANRGDVANVRALHYTSTKQEAIEHIDLVEGLHGKEMNLESSSTDKNWLIFLLSSTSFYVPVSSTDPNKNFLITYNLSHQRTK